MIRHLLLQIFFCWVVFASPQNSSNTDGCDVQATIPVDISQRELALSQQSRFEIWRCLDDHGGHIRLLGFIKREKQPALSLNDTNYWVNFVLAQGNTLVIEIGSAMHVSKLYALQFKGGKPVVAVRDETAGGVSCTGDSDKRTDYLIIRVPQFYFPSNSKIPDHVYHLALE